MADERDAATASSSEDALLSELRAHPHRPALGALVLEVLTRQAEGRTLFVGREHARKLATEHGVSREEAGTSLCNVLDLLERGAETERERALLCSLAVLGLVEKSAARTDDTERVSRTVRHACWLEVATDLPLLSALARETEGEAADQLARELAQQVADHSVGPHKRSPRARASSAALLGALAVTRSADAAAEIASLAAHEGLDPLLRGAAGALAPADAGTASPSLSGPRSPGRRTGLAAVMAWLSGWALVTGAARGALALLGRAGELDVEIRGQSLEVRESGVLLGRPRAATTTVVPLQAILSATREARYGSSALYFGATAMALGVLTGGYVLFDGLRSGELVIASAGAALVLGGILCDFAIDAAARLRGQPRVTVELQLPRGRVVRLFAETEAQADAFLHALRARLR